MVFVPPRFAADSILECIDSKIPLIVAITEGIPVLDMIKVKKALENSESRLINPRLSRNYHFQASAKLELCRAILMPGRVGVVSRSGTLHMKLYFS